MVLQADAGQGYDPLYRASLHTFAIVRSGVAISDAATGIAHPASHMDDARLDSKFGPRRDLTGGWYNAGDYGKWTMMAAISVSYMLQLARIQQQDGRAVDPQLIDEARWGLAWLLKMQDADGGVRHKVDSGKAFAWGLAPEKDPNVRVATGAASLDTADFAAVMYEAGRWFAESDPAMSAKYRQAADRAWTWLEKHPDVRAGDPFYADDDPKEEILWAQCERMLSTRDKSTTAEVEAKLRGFAAHEAGWADPSALGLFDLALDGGAASKLAAAAVLQAADVDVRIGKANAFGVALRDEEYTWGSVEHLLHRTALLVVADRLAPGHGYRQAAEAQMRFVLGNNALGVSFVTGFGEHSVQHPYHWTWMVYQKLMPGWAVGGPNGSPEGADEPLRRLQRAGTPASRCYVDVCSMEGSWASNEGEISENAALMFVSGSLR